jgi:hypothetical protein
MAKTIIGDELPELPSPQQRRTVQRKAAVIAAARAGRVAIDEVCRIYNLSPDEFAAWDRDLDRYGIPGLRSTRYQIYRDTEGPRSGTERSTAAYGRSVTKLRAFPPTLK